MEYSLTKIVRRVGSALRAVALATAVASTPACGEDTAVGEVAINADFPGGNVKVTSNEAGAVHVEPGLRGDNAWFYWYFEATAVKPGRVSFVFPQKVAGFTNGAIGLHGPAVSRDQGRTWNWMGTGSVEGSAFFHDFTRQGERIRFAVTIPYVQSDLARFLTEQASNPHIRQSVLTTSRRGRDVELLQVGEPGRGVKAVLLTGRHHAAETMASYVLEGFLAEAASDSSDGRDFRNRHVLYAVPFVDKDGVEEGDQGKNRKPHDHNRDYGQQSIYPEIVAIKKLAEERDVRFALDFHCPTLVMKDHQVMYFSGAKRPPQYNFENVAAFAKAIKDRLPKDAPYGPLNWLRDESGTSPKNSRYFGRRDGAIMAATFEFPFAPPGKATDPASCREYGRAMLRAWVNTDFHEPDP